MLRCAVQKRYYDKKLLSLYIIERPAAGRQSHLTFCFSSCIFFESCDFRKALILHSSSSLLTFVCTQKWLPKILSGPIKSLVVIVTNHKRAMIRYDYIVEKLYKHVVLIRALQHWQNYNAILKLMPHYSCLYEMFAVKGIICTPWKLDMFRELKANHDVVHIFSLTPYRISIGVPTL